MHVITYAWLLAHFTFQSKGTTSIESIHGIPIEELDESTLVSASPSSPTPVKVLDDDALEAAVVDCLRRVHVYRCRSSLECLVTLHAVREVLVELDVLAGRKAIRRAGRGEEYDPDTGKLVRLSSSSFR